MNDLTQPGLVIQPGERAVHQSRLKHMAKSPKHYAGYVSKDTAVRAKLRAIHALVLEPETFDGCYSVFAGTRNAKHAKYQAHLAEHPGTEVLNPREYEAAQRIAEAVRAHHIAGPMVTRTDGQSEVTVTWRHADTGLLCRGRLDRVQYPQLLDLKTYGTTDPRIIARRVLQTGAHIQAAHYVEGVALCLGVDPRSIRYLLVVAEDSPPYDVGVVELDHDHALRIGELVRRDLLFEVAECEASGLWPGRLTAVEPLTLPPWADPAADLDGMTFTDPDPELP